ncbi:hypothetical protein [Sinorhizobium fredii]|nr:hypothetical protein [Sinorhizobium fredii]
MPRSAGHYRTRHLATLIIVTVLSYNEFLFASAAACRHYKFKEKGLA